MPLLLLWLVGGGVSIFCWSRIWMNAGVFGTWTTYRDEKGRKRWAEVI